jgi:hypothetical protein
MTVSPDDRALILKCVLAMLLLAWILIRFARTCLCDNCSHPNAVRVRGELQLCRECAGIYDKYMKPRYRRLLYFFRAKTAA